MLLNSEMVEILSDYQMERTDGEYNFLIVINHRAAAGILQLSKVSGSQ